MPRKPTDAELAFIAKQWEWTLVTHLSPDMCPCYGCCIRREWHIRLPENLTSQYRGPDGNAVGNREVYHDDEIQTRENIARKAGR